MMKFYLAYGSNLNGSQMRARCPDAEAVGTGFIENHELVFRRSGSGYFLSIDRVGGGLVPVGVWRISDADERALDRYEGFPTQYRKAWFDLVFTDSYGKRQKARNALCYVLPGGRPMGCPSVGYLLKCLEGYDEFGFDHAALYRAVIRSFGYQPTVNWLAGSKEFTGRRVACQKGR